MNSLRLDESFVSRVSIRHAAVRNIDNPAFLGEFQFVQGLALWIVVAFALFWTPPALALINGVSAQSEDQLLRLNFRGSESVCTGFLLDARTILTAAHCLYDSTGTLWTNEDVEIVSTAATLKAERLIPHPLYKQVESSGHDLGLIKVTGLTGRAFRPRFRLDFSTPRTGRIELYGAGKVEIDKKIYGKSKGTSRFMRFGEFIYSIGWSSPTSTPGSAVTIAPNDSGGPIINLESGGVLAIASRTTVNSTKGSGVPAISIGTLLGTSSNRSFIESSRSGDR